MSTSGTTNSSEQSEKELTNSSEQSKKELTNSSEQSKKKLTFEKSLENIKCQQIHLTIQIYILLAICIGIITYSCFVIFFTTNWSDNKYGVLFLSVTFLLILVTHLNKLNKMRDILSNRYLAISAFAEIQPELSNTTKDLSFEYRASLKRILDSVNNLIHNTNDDN